MAQSRWKNTLISLFVIVWTLIFHYESTRHFFLEPLVKQVFPKIDRLPKVKFLFPPAGWIMFFTVDDQFGFAEVYGVIDNVPRLLDPHAIIPIRWIGFDNIHRNILSEVLDNRYRPAFCRYLKRKFPEYDQFLTTAVHYPSLIKRPHERLQAVVYTCE